MQEAQIHRVRYSSVWNDIRVGMGRVRGSICPGRLRGVLARAHACKVARDTQRGSLHGALGRAQRGIEYYITTRDAFWYLSARALKLALPADASHVWFDRLCPTGFDERFPTENVFGGHS